MVKRWDRWPERLDARCAALYPLCLVVYVACFLVLREGREQHCTTGFVSGGFGGPFGLSIVTWDAHRRNHMHTVGGHCHDATFSY